MVVTVEVLPDAPNPQYRKHPMVPVAIKYLVLHDFLDAISSGHYSP